MGKYKLTILGLGNLLLKDEGFGVHFVRHFQDKYCLPENMAIIDGGTLGYALMDVICQTEHLLVVDTVKADDKPGSIYRFSPEAIPACLDYATSAHEVEFLDVLLKAEMLGEAPSTAIIAVVPEDMQGMGMELSKVMQAALLTVEDVVKKEIENLGGSFSLLVVQ
ncbi:MAG: HyaD/HybD family hydrogenase maturation endopeptidase [bacterium]